MTNAMLDGNTLVLPLELFLIRLNRHLHKLIPYRELFYNANERQYYVRIVTTPDDPKHLKQQGPYHYHIMVGLARHINALSKLERSAGDIKLMNRRGTVYDEARLPSHLKFDVLTPVLQAAITALSAKGYTLTPPALAPEPAAERPATSGAVTATVIGHAPECTYHRDGKTCSCGAWMNSGPPRDARPDVAHHAPGHALDCSWHMNTTQCDCGLWSDHIIPEPNEEIEIEIEIEIDPDTGEAR